MSVNATTQLELTASTPPRRKKVEWNSRSAVMADHMNLTTRPVQSVAWNNVDVEPLTIGWVVDNLESYLEERHLFDYQIPSTYSNWDEEYGGPDDDARDENVVCGGIIRDELGSHLGDVLRCRYKPELVEAALRVLSGGGRYSADDYTLKVAVPHAILEGDEGAIAIAPENKEVEADDPDVDLVVSRDD